ncbi:MAG: hypothetical protein ACI3XC_01810, partial [Phascolarctobacterium sp.]
SKLKKYKNCNFNYKAAKKQLQIVYMYIFILSLYVYSKRLFCKKCTKISPAQLLAQGISVLYLRLLFTVKGLV